MNIFYCDLLLLRLDADRMEILKLLTQCNRTDDTNLQLPVNKP